MFEVTVTVDSHQPATGRLVANFIVEVRERVETKFDATASVVFKMFDVGVTTQCAVVIIGRVSRNLMSAGSLTVTMVECSAQLAKPAPA
jgi:hypothetical protein